MWWGRRASTVQCHDMKSHQDEDSRLRPSKISVFFFIDKKTGEWKVLLPAIELFSGFQTIFNPGDMTLLSLNPKSQGWFRVQAYRHMEEATVCYFKLITYKLRS